MMTRLLRDTLRRFGEMAWVTLSPPAGGCRRPGIRHYLTGLALLPLLALFLVYHWIGLLLDEILFRGYRRVAVDQPVFVLGVPRSGTTALHHALARDPQFTTFTTWECLFGISVTWRLVWRGVGHIDRAVGRPLGRLLGLVERRLLGSLQSVHPTGLDLPEEDYWTLLPVLACFVLVVPFPDARSIWRIGRFDNGLTPAERERLMAFYRRCVQRHLYVHGPERHFLSKNAAFAQAAASLLTTFPDARVLCCLRDPAGAVASQIRALEPTLRTLHGDYRRTGLRDRMVALLADHYRCLLAVLSEHAPTRAVFIPSTALQRDLAATVARAYHCLGLELDSGFAAELRSIPAPARPIDHKDARRLRELGLSSGMIGEQFAGIVHEFDFTAGEPMPATRLAQSKANALGSAG